MTCLDANYFLRLLTEPTSTKTHQHHQIAVALFESASNGEVELTATDVVLHEVLYVLTGKPSGNGYGLRPSVACDLLRPLLEIPTFKHPHKRLLLSALDLWSEFPHLGFSDSLTAVYAEDQQMELASFDQHFDDLPQLHRYRPAA